SSGAPRTEDRRIAVCAGSFDPITRGHEDIVRRALNLADVVIVGVARTPTQVKRGLFTIEERVELIRDVFADEPRVETEVVDGLLVEFARARGASLVVRGLRGVVDFEYESQMALMNRQLHPGLETVFLTPAPETAFVSSTLVREISALGGDVSDFVSPIVLRRIRARSEAAPG
ncbi:MAG TPA: pantetheine-phosphate adenylyltransferase, partial [Longimicrobiaceae bacterium]|nr:pantetheine-phosphate adenylyltransferase [Longimicrobiaceae bacterium]